VAKRAKKSGGRRGRASAERSGAPEAKPGPALAAARRSLDGLDAAVALVLALATLAAYANALDAGFVYDDVGSIVENPHVHWRELGLRELAAAATSSPTRRFVANASFGLDHWLFGLDARAYHATNVAIHIACSAFVYLLLRRLVAGEGARIACAVAAAVFALHPIETQAVTYVVQRMASLAALFCVASLLCYARARAPSARGKAGWLAASAVAWIAAVGSKESAAAFPALLWLYEWIVVRGADARAARWMGGVVAVAALAMVALASQTYGDPFRDYRFHDFDLVDRLWSQGRVAFVYAGLVLAPTPSRLSLIHELAPSRGAFEPWTTLPAWIAVVALAALAIARARRAPLVALGVGFVVVALAIESSIFPLRLVHEHRLYAAMVGVAIALAAALRPLAAARPRLLLALALPVLVGLAAATHVRNRAWLDDATLWADVVAKSPTYGPGYQSLGATLARRGDTARARELFERGIAVDPRHGGSHAGLATLEADAGHLERAIELFERAVELDPLDQFAWQNLGLALHKQGRATDAVRALARSVEIFERPASRAALARALAASGRPGEAAPNFARAIELAPEAAGPLRLELARALAASGRVDEARGALEAALASDAAAGARVELASLAWSQGDAAQAVAHLRAALELEPGSLVAANNLAWMLATARDARVRDGEEAARVLARAARDGELDAQALDTRAVVAAARGRHAEALEAARAALAAARAAGDVALASEIEARIALFAAGESYVEPARAGDDQ